MDSAHRWTDAQIEALCARMRREYRKAAREMRRKLDRFMADFQREKSERLKALDGTPEAMAAHEEWLSSQAARAEWMGGMARTLARDASEANRRAFEAVNDVLPHVFAENANMAAFEVESAARVSTALGLVDRDTVNALLRDDPRLLPKPSVNVPKDMRWNMQKMTSAITQGILQGESVPAIAARVRGVGDMDFRAAARAARTAVTGAENAGRLHSYERARDMGIGLRQEWLATLDERTRDSHRALDGEKADVGEEFSNGCRFPGDPLADPAETWNCRCTLVAAVDGIDTSDAERWSRLPEGMTYEEWKLGKDAMLEVNAQKQRQHIEGTREWNDRLARLEEGVMRPSSLLGGVEAAQRLVDEYRGTGDVHYSWKKNGKVQVKESCAASGGSIIGVWRDERSGRVLDTDRFTIHYSGTGSHIIPSRPSWAMEDER